VTWLAPGAGCAGGLCTAVRRDASGHTASAIHEHLISTAAVAFGVAALPGGDGNNRATHQGAATTRWNGSTCRVADHDHRRRPDQRRPAAHGAGEPARLAGVEQLTTAGRGRPDSPRVQFYLGAHRPSWLSNSPVPLFVSVTQLDTDVYGSQRAHRPAPAGTPWTPEDSPNFSVTATGACIRTCTAEWFLPADGPRRVPARLRGGRAGLDVRVLVDRWRHPRPADLCRYLDKPLPPSPRPSESHQEMTVENYCYLL
jgi:hypothetical protein